MDRISICDLFYKRNEKTPFLKQVLTGNEKWIITIMLSKKEAFLGKAE